MEQFPGMGNLGKNRGRDGGYVRSHIVFEEQAEEEVRIPHHHPCDGFLKFRRFKRRHSSNASNTMKGGQAINSFFKAILVSQRELTLPTLFCSRMDGEQPLDAILISRKGMWAVELAKSTGHKFDVQVLSGHGWESFSSHHDLMPRDLICFEQIDRMVFKIHVYDQSACEKDFRSSPNDSRTAEHNGQVARLKRCLGLEAVPSKRGRVNAGGPYKLRNNEFMAQIEEHHLKHNYMTIPGEFVKRNDVREKERAILVNSAGHAWEVELAMYQDQRLREASQRNMKLRNGWNVFFKENNLKKGDVCVFKLDGRSTLATSSSIVMRVVFVRID